MKKIVILGCENSHANGFLKAIADYKAGKKQAMGFLTGQIMRASKGKANPGVIQKKLQEMLSAL